MIDAKFTNMKEALEYCKINNNKIIAVDECGLMPNQRQQMKNDIFEQFKNADKRMKQKMIESGWFVLSVNQEEVKKE